MSNLLDRINPFVDRETYTFRYSFSDSFTKEVTRSKFRVETLTSSEEFYAHEIEHINENVYYNDKKPTWEEYEPKFEQDRHNNATDIFFFKENMVSCDVEDSTTDIFRWEIDAMFETTVTVRNNEIVEEEHCIVEDETETDTYIN